MFTKLREIAPHISSMLEVTEIFKSIQGESTRAGMACTFVRLYGCNLSCHYCDTVYARHEGTPYTLEEIMQRVHTLGTGLVEITGGEPLLQEKTANLCTMLIDQGYTVLVETNGSQDISRIPSECIRIVDVKCPGSGMADSFCCDNIARLTQRDECKMVLSGKKDFDWALDFIYTHKLHEKCTILFSPNTSMVEPYKVAEWIIQSGAPVRLQLQLHTIIWGKHIRGV